MKYSWIFTIFIHNIFWFGRNNFLKFFNISKNNIISVELAKVLRYVCLAAAILPTGWLLSTPPYKTIHLQPHMTQKKGFKNGKKVSWVKHNAVNRVVLLPKF
jgi:hypothetical protein